MLRNSQTELGLAVQTPALGRRPRGPRPSAARLVDGAHDAAAGARRELPWHAAIGYDLLVLLVLRLLWRWMNPVPADA